MGNNQCPVPYLAKFLIDANLINARQKISDMNYLEQKHDEGCIYLMMPETAYEEVMVSKLRKNNWEKYYQEYCNRKVEGTTNRVMKASKYIYVKVIESELTVEDKLIRQRIFEILSIGSRGDVSNDTDIVFCAYYNKYPLITNDGDSKTQIGILGHRTQFKTEFGIEIMNTQEAVNYVQSLIEDSLNNSY